ncbi:hypothetical protein HY642_01665 [Candidatus Woesearchaeota archaeon]|nr:hypothetical protein [Candidatus Woesearchaeota archaeon]
MKAEKELKQGNQGTSEQNESTKKADLTYREDLSIAVMNLISLEEHFAFTTMKTKQPEHLEILAAVRKVRVKLLRELVTNTKGEMWCISKHLLAATMRLMEVATKFIEKDRDKAFELETSAFDLYSLFWLLQSMGDSADQTTAKAETHGLA